MANSTDSEAAMTSLRAKIVDLEEELEGKQAAIGSLLEENEELRLRLSQGGVSYMSCTCRKLIFVAVLHS
jgi:hypothetical protein